MFNFTKKSKKSLRSFYITTTLPYVNANPHIGFAIEIVRADTVARYQRLKRQAQNNEELDSGKKTDGVFFNTGADEHGIKIFKKAEELGVTAQELVDDKSKSFKDLIKNLNISSDKFIRTTDPEHINGARKFWKKCNEAGYIYKKNYRGVYCVGCEMFINEKDLVNGECSDHSGQKLEIIEEENYFFKYSEFAENLLKYYKSKNSDGSPVVIPENRLKEISSLVNNGLEDFSISRLKAKMPWGINVPGDDDHVMYVWFDALVNYISTLGWPEEENFNKFWVEGETVQYCGKDNLQFQSARWQAMLASVGLPFTQKVIINGFILKDGQKMSKSIGNVIDPKDYSDRFGGEALRYFLIRELHPFEDSDFSEDKFIEAYNANLANGLGNVISRIMKMAETNGVKISEDILQKTEKELWLSEKGEEKYHKHFREYNLQKASDEVWKKISLIDSKITETEPFKLIKTDPEKAKKIIGELVQSVWQVVVLLEPFMPETAKKAKIAILSGKKPEPLFARI
jgi:methionyl-tRNA synthetase